MQKVKYWNAKQRRFLLIPLRRESWHGCLTVRALDQRMIRAGFVRYSKLSKSLRRRIREHNHLTHCKA